MMEGSAAVRRPLVAQRPHTGAPVFSRAAVRSVLGPTARWWEARAISDVAAAPDERGGMVFVYRAVGKDGISRLGFARADDGVTITAREADPLFDEMGDDAVRDLRFPRLVRLGGEWVLTVTGNAASDPRILVSPLDSAFRVSHLRPLLPDTSCVHAVLIPREAARLAVLAALPPTLRVAEATTFPEWEGHAIVHRARPGAWDEYDLFPFSPPVSLDCGWLVLVHGKGDDGISRLGALLLDSKRPERVIAKTAQPVFTVPRGTRTLSPGALVRDGDTLTLYAGDGIEIHAYRGSVRVLLGRL